MMQGARLHPVTALAAKPVPKLVADVLPLRSPGRLATVFANNSASDTGGAIACVACGGVVLHAAEFSGNTASTGGALHTTSVMGAHG